jgi:hypothetical protein
MRQVSALADQAAAPQFPASPPGKHTIVSQVDSPKIIVPPGQRRVIIWKDEYVYGVAKIAASVSARSLRTFAANSGGTNMRTVCGFFLGLSFLMLGLPLRLGASEAHPLAVCDSTQNFGLIAKIDIRQPPTGRPGVITGTYFQLKGPDHAALMATPDSYYLMPMAGGSSITEALYGRMFDLLVEAAKNGWIVHVTTSNCNAPTQFAVVVRVEIDY